MPLRSAFLVSASLAALAACSTSTPAPIDYRVGSNPARAAIPPTRTAAVKPAPVAPRTNPPPISAPTLPSSGKPSSSPAVQEAAALVAESAPRPGGSMRQPADVAARRAIAVQKGDTVYNISRKYSVNMRALIETNNLTAPYNLDPGQTVFLPPPNVHAVERGETLYSISRRYNVDTRSLAVMNGLQKPWTVYPGDELLLPPLAREAERSEAIPVAATPPPQPVAPAPKPTAVAAAPAQLASAPPPQMASAPPPRIAPVSAPAPAAASTGPAGPISLTPAVKSAAGLKVVAGDAGGGLFVWPVSGSILSGFGIGADGVRNDGVNIAAEPGSQVKAAAAGDVVYSGNELTGFGNLLLIRHADGWVTAYAHAEKLLVKEGDKVAQGQPIAVAGVTGRPQLHFELRKGKDPVDPLGKLPAPQS